MSDSTIDSLRTGDLIRWPSGTIRRLNAVKHTTNRNGGPTSFFTMQILRHSWTCKEYTVYTRSDFRTLGVRLFRRAK